MKKLILIATIMISAPLAQSSESLLCSNLMVGVVINPTEKSASLLDGKNTFPVAVSEFIKYRCRNCFKIVGLLNDGKEDSTFNLATRGTSEEKIEASLELDAVEGGEKIELDLQCEYL